LIDLHVVIAWIDNPKPRQLHFAVDRLFLHRVGVMIVGANHLRHQPEFVGGGGYQRKIRAENIFLRELDAGPDRQEVGGGEAGHDSRDALMQARADLFVAWAQGQAKDGLAVHNFLIGIAH